MRKFILLVFLAGLFTTANAQVNARLFQFPDVSETMITFVYGDDVWIAPKTGGLAHRLSSPEGTEAFPRFSPDGKHIAFSGNYDGNTDIYVIPTQGGIPERVTHHGMSDRMLDWTPDGEALLYASSMESGKQRWSQIYKVSPEGGLPEKLPMEHAEFGSLSPDGGRIAFTDKSRVFRTWKRYRGGTAPDIWIFDLKSYSAENITNNDANDELPMWSGNKIYYLSDQGKEMRANIWVYDTQTKKSTQLTKFKDFDVHFPSIGPKDLVFEAGGQLYLMDLSTNNYKKVEIQVVSDLTAVKPRKENVQRYLQGASLAPDGNRVIVQARGELFSVPAEKGYVENMTQRSGVAERSPSWSPNGRYVAYWSDESGEYELTIRDLKENGKERKVTDLGPGFRYSIYWSPDSKHVAFIDQTMTIYTVDIESGKANKVDQDIGLLHGPLTGWSASWSPESKWLAYAKTQMNGNSAIHMYNLEEDESTQVTSGFYSERDPSFDPKGEYLYLTTNRSFTPVYGNFDNSWTYPNATQLAAIALKSETASPLAAENDEVTIKEDEEDKEDEKEQKEEEGKDDGSTDEEDEEEEEETIEFENFERRLVVLPVPAGNIGSVTAAEGKVLFMRYPAAGAEGMPALNYYDMKERKEQTIMNGAMGYDLSADGKKILVMQGGRLGVISAAPGQKLENTLPLDKMEMMLEPRKEWAQIFNDAWRFERDYFYDKNMHGVNWDAMRKQYGDLIKYAVSRSDVNFIIGELIGELNASHTYRGGGDQEMPKRKRVGYLGIDWEMENGHYKVKKIIRGAPWDNEVVSPLDAPGVDVNEGDYILAVNGIALNSYMDPWGAFEGLANETVELTVNNSTSMEGSRKVVVKTLSDETRLRHLAWIDQNRSRVMEASDGKIGYIYVPSTGVDGQNELVRQFMGQWHLPGLIIDERFNNGGQIPDRFIELLNRKPLAYWDIRDGQTWQWPPVAHFGPKAMLINGWSGSGGDAFPDYFRKSGLGPLIGTRTWGGLIGISGAPSLIDNGVVTVPTFRMFDPDGEWFKEGHGVDPDIEVIEHPTALAKGIDPQLEAAIENVLMQIEKEGVNKPKTPKMEKR